MPGSMMPSRFILLTGAFESDVLLPHFRRLAPACNVIPARSRDELLSVLATSADGADTRLLAFCTAIIVPAVQLGFLEAGAYNIHPGPPTYPGRHPESWGAYHAVERFGATFHAMVPRVDEGAIIDVEWFDIAPPITHLELGSAAFSAALRLTARWAHALLHEPGPLPVSDAHWSGTKTRRSDLEAMLRITPDLDAAEFARRLRGFGAAKGTVFTLDLHGCRFTHVTEGKGDAASE